MGLNQDRLRNSHAKRFRSSVIHDQFEFRSTASTQTREGEVRFVAKDSFAEPLRSFITRLGFGDRAPLVFPAMQFNSAFIQIPTQLALFDRASSNEPTAPGRRWSC